MCWHLTLILSCVPKEKKAERERHHWSGKKHEFPTKEGAIYLKEFEAQNPSG